MNRGTVLSALAARVRLFTLLSAMAAMNLVVYTVQLADSNAYMGFQPVALGTTYWLILGVSISMLTVLIPVDIRRPSTFFALVYGFFVLLPFALLHSVAGDIGMVEYFVRFAILLGPLLAISALAGMAVPVRLPSIVDARFIEWLIAAFCVAAAAAAIANGPQSAGFDLDEVYVRRLEGREVFATGSPLAYMMAMVGNGFLPFLAFAAGLSTRRSLLAISVAVALAMFYVIGTKGPFVYLVLAFVVGRSLARERPHFLHRFIGLGLSAVFVVFLVERAFWDITFSGEFIFRRAFAVPAQVMSYYFDFTLGHQHLLWSSLEGTKLPDGLTFHIGDLFYGINTANVNTNAYLHALATAGVPGYAATIALTAALFALLDAGFRGTSNRAFMFLGFAYSILLVEQAATTALATSGIGVLGLLVGLAAGGWRPNTSSPSVRGPLVARAS